MKRSIFILFFSFLLCFSMQFEGFASTVTNNGGASSVDITGNFLPTESKADVYSVDIVWGSMEFNYEVPAPVWDPVTHTYKSASESGIWTCADGANKVAVHNRSNADVNVSVLAETTTSDITVNVMNYSFLLESAAKNASTTQSGEETANFAYIKLLGKLTDREADQKEIGTITVVIERSTQS